MLSDKELLRILSLSKDAVAVYDTPEINIRFANDAMCKFWGKHSGVTGKTLEQALPELEGQPFPGLLKNVWSTGTTYNATDTPATLMIDGKPKTSYFDFEYRAILNDSGEVWAILHTASDVSSRVLARQQLSEKQLREKELLSELVISNKNIQEANDHLSAANRELIASSADISRLNERLQESETDFRRLVEQAPVAIMVFQGEQLEIALANQRMLEILNKDVSVLGKPLLVSMPELEGEAAVDLIFEAFRTGKEFDGNEVPVRMKRGAELETRYFNFSYRPLFDAGQVIGVMDLAVEVTGQVLARRQLEAIIAEKTVLEGVMRANEHRLQSILDTMAEGVMICSLTGNTIYANHMAQQILGVQETHLLQYGFFGPGWTNERSDGALLTTADHPVFVALNTGLPFQDQEVCIRMPERELLYLSLNAVPLTEDTGAVTGCTVTFTDVTSRVKLLQQKDDFISVASHELKTPMTTLKASLQVLAQMVQPGAGDGLSAMVSQANRSMNKLNDLVNTLLHSNRASESRFPLNKSRFRIADLVNDCCRHVANMGSRIVLEGATDLEITADEQLIEQVIVNFVNNALKYAPESKDIVIHVFLDNGYARVSVTDSGAGIHAEELPHIFERYYRAGRPGGSVPGLGLGLYIAAEIIHRHNGEIGVESELGTGTTFWFKVPV